MEEDDDETIRDLRRRARGRVGLPARCMIIMAALGCGVGIALLALASGAADGPQRPTEVELARRPIHRAIGLFAVVWCGLIAYGAWEMDRLGNLRAAKLAAWLAVIPVPIPLYILWVIGAIVGLVALNDPAVRAAFASGNADARKDYLAANTYRPPRAPRRGRPRGATEWAAGRDESVWRERDARSAVTTVSVVMLVFWVLGMLAACGLAFMAGAPLFIKELDTPATRAEGPFLRVMAVFALMYTTLGLYGAWQSFRLRSHPWAMTSAILLLITSLGCIPGIVVGVWALKVLLRPGVRDVFGRAVGSDDHFALREVLGQPDREAGGRSTPLHAAVLSGSAARVEALLDGGADPNRADARGNGPLWDAVHLACLAGRTDDNLEVVRLLVAAGADPDHENRNGSSPRDKAERRDRTVARLLPRRDPRAAADRDPERDH